MTAALRHLQPEESIDLTREPGGEHGDDREEHDDDEPEPHPRPAGATPVLDARAAARAVETVGTPHGVPVDRRRLGAHVVFELLGHDPSVRP